MAAETYVRRLAKISIGVSAVCVAEALQPCGSLVAFVILVPHLLAIIILLALPLAWNKLKKRPLEPEAARWARYAAGAIVVATLATMFVDYGSGCFR